MHFCLSGSKSVLPPPLRSNFADFTWVLVAATEMPFFGSFFYARDY